MQQRVKPTLSRTLAIACPPSVWLQSPGMGCPSTQQAPGMCKCLHYPHTEFFPLYALFFGRPNTGMTLHKHPARAGLAGPDFGHFQMPLLPLTSPPSAEGTVWTAPRGAPGPLCWMSGQGWGHFCVPQAGLWHSSGADEMYRKQQKPGK